MQERRYAVGIPSGVEPSAVSATLDGLLFVMHRQQGDFITLLMWRSHKSGGASLKRRPCHGGRQGA